MTPSKARILLLEDAADVRLIVQATLSDMDLVMVTNLNDAKRITAEREFDLYILDINLPDGNSFEFCEQLRAGPRGGDWLFSF